MIDQDIDPQLEQHLRVVLREVAQRFEPHPAVLTVEQSSGRLMRYAAAVILVAGITGLGLVAARRASDPAGTNDAPPAPTQPTDSSRPADRLLYPTAPAATGAPQLTIAALPDGQRALVQAPDGALYRVSAGKQGGYAPGPNDDVRDIGAHQVIANSDGETVGYSWTDGCVVTSVSTAVDGPTWGSERLQLLGSFTTIGGAVNVQLPDGWNVVDQGHNAPLVQLSYGVELDGVARAIVLGQALDASIAALGSPMGPMEPVSLVDGTPAWFEPRAAPSPRLSFSRNGVAVWLWGDGLTADDLIEAATTLAPAPAAWESLLTDGADIAPTGTTPPGGEPDLCGSPTLAVTPQQ